LLPAVHERDLRQSKLGLYFFNASGLNEAVRIELVGERQRRDPKAQYRKNRTPREQSRSGKVRHVGVIASFLAYNMLI
jgi:hypothetical protein